ncbi:MAG TPA: S8 family peptidase, partial [Flavisolibacter sp.]|nr:S8 family peptidase [Flavisolibacter sp.]
ITLSSYAQKAVPNGWHLGSEKTTGYYGIGLDEAYKFLKGKTSQTVVVAVIDSGIDTLHEDLRPVMWTNPKEIPGNGIDDDKNGYVDDVHGWNFLGGKDGRNVGKDSYEAARVYYRYKGKFETVKDPSALSKEDQELYKMWAKSGSDVNKGVDMNEVLMIKRIYPMVKKGDSVVAKDLGKPVYSIKDIQAYSPTDKDAKALKEILTNIGAANNGNTDITNKQIIDDIESQLNKAEASGTAPINYRGDIVKDNEADINDRAYGNNDIMATGADHGTHVSGIIAAARDNKKGIEGVADNVRIMTLRAVPDGDEHDKDIALAIRYAADNGAKVINMSFGKGVSPEKSWVDDAVKYAESKGVLLVHAAGNDAANIDTAWNFPTPVFKANKQRASNWLTIGASGAEKNKVVANFSNYGKEEVDVFAPGVNIYSSVPGGNTYANFSGTSMASPVVAGVAALILEYYPKFTPQQVKMIIEKSAVPFPAEVTNPGTGDKVPFSDLSRTGGLVNAYEAIKMADALSKDGKIKTATEKIKVDDKELKIKTKTPAEKKKVKVVAA